MVQWSISTCSLVLACLEMPQELFYKTFKTFFFILVEILHWLAVTPATSDMAQTHPALYDGAIIGLLLHKHYKKRGLFASFQWFHSLLSLLFWDSDAESKTQNVPILKIFHLKTLTGNNNLQQLQVLCPFFCCSHRRRISPPSISLNLPSLSFSSYPPVRPSFSFLLLWTACAGRHSPLFFSIPVFPSLSLSPSLHHSVLTQPGWRLQHQHLLAGTGRSERKREERNRAKERQI